MLEAINIEKKVKLIIRYDHSYNGYYLYVYNLESNKCIIDHLCDDLSQALYIAKEDYSIYKNEFKEIDDII